MGVFRKKHIKKKETALDIIRNKLLVFLLTIIFISTLLGLTMAWFTASDTQANSFEGTSLIAEIDETFSSKEGWYPGEKVIKEIRVENVGSTPAIVRLSLYEFLVSFKIDVIDQTGNANLQVADKAVQPILDPKDTNSWEAASRNNGTYLKNSIYYVADKTWLSDPVNKIGMVKYNDINRNNTPYQYLTLNFSDKLKTQFDNNIQENYWLYDDGYFYYSKILDPGEKTINLLNSITLSGVMPNKYKGSLYKMKVFMDAHDKTEPIIDSWGLKEEGPANDLIKNLLK